MPIFKGCAWFKKNSEVVPWNLWGHEHSPELKQSCHFSDFGASFEKEAAALKQSLMHTPAYSEALLLNYSSSMHIPIVVFLVTEWFHFAQISLANQRLQFFRQQCHVQGKCFGGARQSGDKFCF